jgi:transposase
MNARKLRGEQIAKMIQIQKKGLDKWIVPSQSGSGAYTVNRSGENFKCSCPDFQNRMEARKHIYAVEIKVLKWFDNQGNSGTEVTITKRMTYQQDWPNYDKAQTHEKELFMKLLNDLVQNIPEKQLPTKAGRPELSMQDMVFGSALKVFTTFSLRRFMTDIKEAKDKEYIRHIPHFTFVSVYMKKAEMTPILQQLITITALPLKAVETKFAIDSTGFRTTKFNDYCREKHKTEQYHNWVKAHICSGVSTHIITGIEVLEEHSADSLQFIPLSQRTYESGFKIEEMSADKAYSSRDNNAYIAQIGGTPFIPFRKGATGKPRGSNHVWRKMYNYFVFNRDEFLQHYHLRSNIESTNNMIKAKFTDIVRSKDKTAQVNEVLLKVLCHNICVLIGATYELGIEPNLIS